MSESATWFQRMFERAIDALRVEADTPGGNLNASGVAVLALFLLYAGVFEGRAEFFTMLAVFVGVLILCVVWLDSRALR